MRDLTEDRGVDVFFDPVAAGEYLGSEIKSLATGGTVWIYGLLGGSGTVDLTPLIRKGAAIRGFAVNELISANETACAEGCRHILDRLAEGIYHQHVDRTFKLEDAAQAQQVMEAGDHVGKLVLVP